MVENENISTLTSDFSEWIATLKNKIRSARNKLVFSVNSQVLELYWELGKDIAEKQQQSSFGSNFIEQISEELKRDFPEIKGFSRRNLYAILQWYKFYMTKYQFVPHRVAQIPWSHNRIIVSKIKDIEVAEFYVEETAKNAWDRDTLEIQIENKYHLKADISTHNFSNTLSAKQSELATQTLKDPYNFDFLGLENDALEKAIEDELIKNVTKFLLEHRILPITISDICLISYKDFYGLDNAAMIENGRSEVIPTQQFHAVKKEILSYKANKNTPVFIHLGKFSKQKNHQLLIDTFNRVDKKGADFLLLIIGADFDSDEGKQLQKGACDKIKFLGTKQNVNDYLLNANAFCLSSIYEGLPISLLEALSAGCVPICTPAGGIPNVITHGVTGILSDDFSDLGYYEAVMSYLNNRVPIDREVFIQYFKENYSINKSAILHHELYSQ